MNGLGYRSRDAETQAQADKVCQHIGSIYGKSVVDDISGLFEREIFEGRCFNFDGVDDRIDIRSVPNIGTLYVSGLDENGALVTDLSIAYVTDHYEITKASSGKVWNVKVWTVDPATDAPKLSYEFEPDLFAWYKCDEGLHSVIAHNSVVGGTYIAVGRITNTNLSFYDFQNIHSFANEKGYFHWQLKDRFDNNDDTLTPNNHPAEAWEPATTVISVSNGVLRAERTDSSGSHTGVQWPGQIVPRVAGVKVKFEYRAKFTDASKNLYIRFDDASYNSGAIVGDEEWRYREFSASSGLGALCYFLILSLTEIGCYLELRNITWEIPSPIPIGGNHEPSYFYNDNNTPITRFPYRAKKNAAFRQSNCINLNGTDSYIGWSSTTSRNNFVDAMLANSVFTCYLRSSDFLTGSLGYIHFYSQLYWGVRANGKPFFGCFGSSPVEVELDAPTGDFTEMYLKVDLTNEEVTLGCDGQLQTFAMPGIFTDTTSWRLFFDMIGRNAASTLDTDVFCYKAYNSDVSIEDCRDVYHGGDAIRYLPMAEGGSSSLFNAADTGNDYYGVPSNFVPGSDWVKQDVFHYNLLKGCHDDSPNGRIVPAKANNTYQRADEQGATSDPCLKQIHKTETLLQINPHNDPKIFQITGKDNTYSVGYSDMITDLANVPGVTFDSDSYLPGQFGNIKITES